MYKFLVFSVIALLAFQNVAAKPKAKQAAAAKQQETSNLQELAANVQAGINNATAILQGNLPDSKDVVKKLNENAQTLANNVQDTVTKIKTELQGHQGDLDNILKQVSKNLAETNAKLQEALGPDGQKKASEIKAKLEQGLKEAATEAEKLTKAIEPEATKVKDEIKSVTQNFLEQLSKVTQDLANWSKQKQ